MTTEEWTIGRLLTWTADYLRQRQADNPRLDAEVLLAEAKECERIQLYTAFNEVADERVRTAFRELVRRRAEGTPVAYLVGRREFYSLSFQVTPDVLIPRPETEFVVIGALDLAREAGEERPWELADVGTGSGAIAVSLAKHLPQARVTALDLSGKAIEIARKNAEKHGVADRVSFAVGDLLAELPPTPQFDFIVSNPPYVTEAEYAALPREIKEHEPRLAFVGGPIGTEVISRLVGQVAERLRTGGWFLTEISPMIEEQVVALLAADGRFEPATTIKDLAGLARVIRARRKKQPDA